MAKTLFIEKSLQCFADSQRFGAEAASFGGVVNGAEGELVFGGPGMEGDMFAKERGPKVRIFFICQPFHNV
jgi:hypothetical protein